MSRAVSTRVEEPACSLEEIDHLVLLRRDRQPQAAELLKVSRRTIYNRIREGRLQTIRTLGGSQRVLIDSMQSSTGDNFEAARDDKDRHAIQGRVSI